MASKLSEAESALSVNDDDVARMRAVKRQERLISTARWVSYGASGLFGMVTGATLISSRSDYPWTLTIPVVASVGTRRPPWRTPLILVTSFLIGLGFMGIGNAESFFGEGTYYGAYSRNR